MRNKRLIIMSIVLNSILLIFELLSVSEVFLRYLPDAEPFPWYYTITYYTNISNIILLLGTVCSLILDIKDIAGIGGYKSSLVKWCGVITTQVTFVTVWLLILVSGEIQYGIDLTGSMWLFMHTICPILGLITFILFDFRNKVYVKDIFIPVLVTIIYTLAILVLSLFGGRIPYASNLEGYFQITWYFILLCGFIETIVTTGLGFLIGYIKNLFIMKKNIFHE